MKRLLLNYDVASLYPSLICEYNYSSRNQPDANKYKELKALRIQAKHNEDKKLAKALKLPLNTYYGALGAEFNDLYDLKQCRSVCVSGQCALLILIHDLREIPTVRFVESNTDAVMFEIDEDYVEQAKEVLDNWQKRYRLELEEDKILKLVMRDINNYCEIVQTSKGKQVNFKGACFAGCPEILIDENNKIITNYKPNFRANSLSICAEAILKNLLFNIPVETTINNCNDPIRFQVINHLGSTYEKIVLEDNKGNQTELQRNNRIYAGLVPTGKIYKIKPDGRKDSLASCPVNPIVDNDNKVSIDQINKKWYIKYTKQKINDFKGEKEVFMEEKLDKLKKDELIALVKEMKEKEENMGTYNESINECNEEINETKNLLTKINDFRQRIRSCNFILDKALPNNLGGGEYVSIEQYYQATQECAMASGLDFSFEIVDVSRFDLDAFRPATGSPQHIATVHCLFTLTDIDTGYAKTYVEIAQGSDTVDKAVSGASTLAYRNWFDKNFTPKIFNGKEVHFGDEDNNVSLDGVNIPNNKGTGTPKVFISNEKKEEIKKEITSTVTPSSNEEDKKELTELIYKFRELSGDETKGAKTLDAIIKGTITDAEILSKTLSFKNAITNLTGEVNG